MQPCYRGTNLGSCTKTDKSFELYAKHWGGERTVCAFSYTWDHHKEWWGKNAYRSQKKGRGSSSMVERKTSNRKVAGSKPSRVVIKKRESLLLLTITLPAAETTTWESRQEKIKNPSSKSGSDHWVVSEPVVGRIVPSGLTFKRKKKKEKKPFFAWAQRGSPCDQPELREECAFVKAARYEARSKRRYTVVANCQSCDRPSRL